MTKMLVQMMSFVLPQEKSKGCSLVVQRKSPGWDQLWDTPSTSSSVSESDQTIYQISPQNPCI